jgi:hypothetical protein
MCVAGLSIQFSLWSNYSRTGWWSLNLSKGGRVQQRGGRALRRDSGTMSQRGPRVSRHPSGCIERPASVAGLSIQFSLWSNYSRTGRWSLNLSKGGRVQQRGPRALRQAQGPCPNAVLECPDIRRDVSRGPLRLGSGTSLLLPNLQNIFLG